MSNSDLPEMVPMQQWTNTPPDDTGHYWFRATGMNAAIARIFFVVIGRKEAPSKVDFHAQSVLFAELTARGGFDHHAIEQINEPVATLAQRPGAQWSDARIMPPETRA